MIRVLIADDSPLVAEILRTTIEQDPEITVIGRAVNGAEAVELTRRMRPDVLLMDVGMPVMDGIEATSAIMADTPVPILVLSASVGSDANVAFRAIQAGAIDVVEKPTGTLQSDYTRLGLIRHLKLVARIPPIRRGKPRQVQLPREREGESKRALAIAASTGGPPAFCTVLGSFPADFPVPILAVQHISRGFLASFVEWLDDTIGLEVRVAQEAEPAQAGVVYFPPEDHHLGFSPQGLIELSTAPPVDGHRPSATHLFRSVADSCGARSIGVLLTGMGRDGASGLQLMREHGALTICQDEATSVIYGMPGAAVELGAATAVLPISDIAGEIASVLSAKA